jgi:hypothetical protein
MRSQKCAARVPSCQFSSGSWPRRRRINSRPRGAVVLALEMATRGSVSEIASVCHGVCPADRVDNSSSFTSRSALARSQALLRPTLSKYVSKGFGRVRWSVGLGQVIEITQERDEITGVEGDRMSQCFNIVDGSMMLIYDFQTASGLGPVLSFSACQKAARHTRAFAHNAPPQWSGELRSDSFSRVSRDWDGGLGVQRPLSRLAISR